jgi:hypothetical protein
MPNAKFWKTGLESNTIFKVDMKRPKGKVSSSQYFLTGSLGITEKICFDGKAGIGDIVFDERDSEKITHSPGFAGAYGGRVVLYDDEKRDLRFIMGLHHISVHPEDTKIGNKKYEVILDEWQCSLLVSKRIMKLKPYIAPKFSQIYLIRKVNSERKRIKPEDSWGLVVGADLDINENARFHVEGRFFDEDSFTFGLNYTF